MTELSLFDQDSEVKKIAQNRWTTQFSKRWAVGSVINGGYAMAVVAKAMVQETELPHPLSITAYYLDRSDAGEATIETELIRSGRNVSTVGAKLIQEGKERIRFMGAFTDLNRKSGETFLEEKAPVLPPIDECESFNFDKAPVEINKRFELHVPEGYTANRGQQGNISEFLCYAKFPDSDVVAPHALCLFSDAFMPAVFNRVGPVAWVPTIELTVHLRDVPAPGFLTCRFRTRYLTNGTLEEDGDIWDSEGKLVALSRQMAKLRIPDKKK